MFEHPLALSLRGSVLVVTGSVDEYAMTDLRERLAELDPQVADLVVDLSGVDFLPSSAIGVLVRARADRRRAGRSLTLVAAAGTTAQSTLAITGLPYLLEVTDPASGSSAG